MLLSAAALVVLPLLPDRAVDPYGVVNPRVVWLWLPLVAAGLVAVLYGGMHALRALRSEGGSHAPAGRAFQPRTAIVFAATVTAVLFMSALLAHFFGATGGVLGVAVAGFADAHSSAVSAASLARAGGLTPNAALLAILLAFSTNTLTKAVAAFTSGGSAYALRVLPGLVLMLIAAWAGALFAGVKFTLG